MAETAFQEMVVKMSALPCVLNQSDLVVRSVGSCAGRLYTVGFPLELHKLNNWRQDSLIAGNSERQLWAQCGHLTTSVGLSGLLTPSKVGCADEADLCHLRLNVRSQLKQAIQDD